MKKIIFTNLLTVILALQVTDGTAATTVVQCDTSTITSQLNTCTPEVTLNIASIGSVFSVITNVSVQSSIVSSIFDTSAPVAKITNTNSPYHVSFYGQTRPNILGGSSKRILVNITNWPNSSSVGISQLLSSKSVPISNYPANAFYGYGPVTYNKKFTYPNNCTTVDSSNPLTPVLSCTIASTSYKPNLVISHVAPGEYEALNRPVSGSLGKLSIIRSTPTFVQGFGIAVNDNFYRALQGKNISDGVLPSSCSIGDKTGACQPSIKQAQLASLISKDGVVKASSDLIPGDTTALTLNQTVVTHSQKAAQNLLLLNNPCGLTTNVNKLNAALTPISSANNTNKLTVTENFQYNSDLATAISTGAGYQIGLVTVGSNSLYIKLNESSPNFDVNGQASYARRTQTANGLNPLAIMTYAVRMVNEDASVKALVDAFWLTLQSSAWSDIWGLAYIDGATDSQVTPKQSNVQRLQNTNCSPLINYKNSGVINTPSQPEPTTPQTPMPYVPKIFMDVNHINGTGYQTLSGINLPKGSQDRTYVAWIKTNTNGMIFSYAPPSCLGNENLRIGTDGTVRWVTNCADTWGTKAINDNKWHLIVATYTNGPVNSNTKIFIDNNIENVYFTSFLTAGTRNTTSTDVIYIGGVDQGLNEGRILLSGVQIWTRVLTYSEINDLYLNGTVSNTSNLVFRLPN